MKTDELDFSPAHNTSTVEATAERLGLSPSGVVDSLGAALLRNMTVETPEDATEVGTPDDPKLTENVSVEYHAAASEYEAVINAPTAQLIVPSRDYRVTRAYVRGHLAAEPSDDRSTGSFAMFLSWLETRQDFVSADIDAEALTKLRAIEDDRALLRRLIGMPLTLEELAAL